MPEKIKLRIDVEISGRSAQAITSVMEAKTGADWHDGCQTTFESFATEATKEFLENLVDDDVDGPLIPSSEVEKDCVVTCREP